MLKVIRCLAISAMMALMMIMSAHAQQHTDNHSTHSAGIVCGSDWMNEVSHDEMLANTARNRPETYRRIMAMASEKRQNLSTLGAAEDEPEWEFKVSNRVTNQYDFITGVLVWEGKYARIWVDKADWTNASRKTAISKFLPSLQRALDTASGATSRNKNQGIIQNDEEVYGPAPSRFAADWDFKTNFLMTDIKDEVVGGFVGGYFSPTDQFPAAEKPASNEMNLLYIDSKDGLAGGINALASTIAHEYQHLIHNGFNRNSDIVFNEGASEVASILNGYMDRDNRNYLANMNLDMFRWSHDDGTKLLVDYSRAMTLIHYFTEQFGELFLSSLLKSQVTGMDRLGEAMSGSGHGSDWKGAMKGYAVANYLQATGPYDAYKYRTSLRGGAAKVTRTYTGQTFFSDTSLQVEPYGTHYLLFNNPQGALKFRTHADRDYTVMTMAYRGSTIIVGELEHDKDQWFGEWGAYDKVVLAITNLSGSQQFVSLSASHLTLGVEDESAAVAGLTLLGNTPNPVQGTTTIAFAVPHGEAVTLQIYNTHGELVTTLIDGERMEAGEHQVRFQADDLVNGYYIARLRQGDRTASSPIIIVR
jgi:hypothetical protein